MAPSSSTGDVTVSRAQSVRAPSLRTPSLRAPSLRASSLRASSLRADSAHADPCAESGQNGFKTVQLREDPTPSSFQVASQ